MFKWLWKSSSEESQPIEPLLTPREPAPDRLSALRASGETAPANGPKPGVFLGFDAIYQSGMRVPGGTYGIKKVMEMIDSPHLAGMSIEAKRAALMMALEAAAVAPDDILQDAMLRQRALKEYADKETARLAEFEGAKARENGIIQADLDRHTAECMARIQDNLNQVAKYQDDLAAWQNRKQAEWRRIADAAALCSPAGQNGGGNHNASVMVRYEAEVGTTARR